MAENQVDPRLSVPELTQQVFDNPFGHALLTKWLTDSGLTDYDLRGPKDLEYYIRKDENHRRLFSIIKILGLSEDDILKKSIDNAEEYARKQAAQRNIKTYE